MCSLKLETVYSSSVLGVLVLVMVVAVVVVVQLTGSGRTERIVLCGAPTSQASPGARRQIAFRSRLWDNDGQSRYDFLSVRTTHIAW